MNDYVDIKEAIKLTGTSDSTIRRFLRDLSDEDRQQYTGKEGRKVIIDRKFLLRSFDVNEALTVNERLPAKKTDFDVVQFQQQQLHEKDKQIGRLQDQNDKLLEDLERKDEDLKASWSKISQLQDENNQLTGEVKALKAADEEEQRQEKRSNVILYVLLSLLVALVVYVLLSSF